MTIPRSPQPQPEDHYPDSPEPGGTGRGGSVPSAETPARSTHEPLGSTVSRAHLTRLFARCSLAREEGGA